MTYRLKITSAFDLSKKMNSLRVRYPQFIYFHTQAGDVHVGLFDTEPRYIISVTGDKPIAEFEKIKDYLIAGIENENLRIEFEKL